MGINFIRRRLIKKWTIVTIEIISEKNLNEWISLIRTIDFIKWEEKTVEDEIKWNLKFASCYETSK